MAPTAADARLARLEQQLRELAERPSRPRPMTRPIEELTARLAELETTARGGAGARHRSGTANRIAALEGEVRALAERVGVLGAPQRRDRGRCPRRARRADTALAESRKVAQASAAHGGERPQRDRRARRARRSRSSAPKRRLRRELAKRDRRPAPRPLAAARGGGGCAAQRRRARRSVRRRACGREGAGARRQRARAARTVCAIRRATCGGARARAVRAARRHCESGRRRAARRQLPGKSARPMPRSSCASVRSRKSPATIPARRDQPHRGARRRRPISPARSPNCQAAGRRARAGARPGSTRSRRAAPPRGEPPLAADALAALGKTVEAAAMIRVVLFLVVVGLLALGAVWLADRPGEVAITWQGRRIETSVMVLLVAVAAIAVLAAVAVVGAARDPALARHTLRCYLSSRRGVRGYLAVSQGLIAIGSRRRTRRHEVSPTRRSRIAPGEPLTLLLSAQAAQLSGDRAAAERAFRVMARATTPSCLACMACSSRRSGATTAAAARLYAEEAAKNSRVARLGRPGGVRIPLCRGRLGRRAASGSSATCKQRPASTSRAYRRQRAVLLTARALAASRTAIATRPRRSCSRRSSSRRRWCRPPRLPAGCSAKPARLRKAARIVEAAWKANPHPDLAEAYAHLRLGDSARDRLHARRGAGEKGARQCRGGAGGGARRARRAGVRDRAAGARAASDRADPARRDADGGARGRRARRRRPRARMDGARGACAPRSGLDRRRLRVRALDAGVAGQRPARRLPMEGSAGGDRAARRRDRRANGRLATWPMRRRRCSRPCAAICPSRRGPLPESAVVPAPARAVAQARSEIRNPPTPPSRRSCRWCMRPTIPARSPSRTASRRRNPPRSRAAKAGTSCVGCLSSMETGSGLGTLLATVSGTRYQERRISPQ